MKIIKNGFRNERLGVELDVYVIEGREWFKAQDISEFLGYQKTTNMTRNIDFIEENSCTHIMSTAQGNNYDALFINEFALYEIICKIRKSDIDRYLLARNFQKWVFGEVLPSLRNNNSYIDKDNITDEQVDNTIDEAVEIKRQRDNLENGIRFNKKFKCDLKNYLENLYPNIEDVYEQFIENMKLGKMLDDKGVPTDKFMEYNQRYNMFEHITKVSDKINIRLRLTNLGYINLAKRIYEKDGKIYLNKNYEREE